MVITENDVPKNASMNSLERSKFFYNAKVKCNKNNTELVFVSFNNKGFSDYDLTLCDKIIVSTYLMKEADWSSFRVIKDRHCDNMKIGGYSITYNELIRYV